MTVCLCSFAPFAFCFAKKHRFSAKLKRRRQRAMPRPKAGRLFFAGAALQKSEAAPAKNGLCPGQRWRCNPQSGAVRNAEAFFAKQKSQRRRAASPPLAEGQGCFAKQKMRASALRWPSAKRFFCLGKGFAFFALQKSEAAPAKNAQ